MTETLNDNILQSFLELAENTPVHHLTPDAVAHKAGLSLTDLPPHLTDGFDFADAYIDTINQRVVYGFQADPQDSVRERLFDLFMQYFDELSLHKNAALNIERGFKARPGALCKRHKLIFDLFGEMLTVCQANAKGLRGRLRIRSLQALFLLVYNVWRTDDTEDMAKTMAALDKHLAKAEQWEAKLTCPLTRRSVA
ncbi:hypothetical protein [Terasakiella pusilla]|uniref:hypothetical protein n=1 Tax=Terasakiella pusilla TaxID=64973 RepID=UPI003AA97B13